MRRIVTAIAAVVLCLLPAPAQASTRDQIIKDCADGRLDGTYSPSDLRDARQNLPSDVAEYTNCADLLRRAEIPDTPGATGGGTPGGTGGPGAPGAPGAPPGGTPATPQTPGGAPPEGGGPLVPTTPEDLEAVKEAQAAGRAGAVVDGRRVLPGLSATSVRNDLPETLLVALIVLVAAGVALAVPAARRGLPLLRRRTGP